MLSTESPPSASEDVAKLRLRLHHVPLLELEQSGILEYDNENELVRYHRELTVEVSREPSSGRAAVISVTRPEYGAEGGDYQREAVVDLRFGDLVMGTPFRPLVH